MTQTEAVVQKVSSYASSHVAAALERLSDYLTIPAISCEKDHHADVSRLATMINADLGKLGFESRVIELEGALPIVAAERNVGLDKPTVLIYGHFDLQPVRGEAWKTPPHEATIRGERMYGRGSSDDMGGWVSHIAALDAWLNVAGELPLNVKLILEGEEEIGSPNLERYMNEHPEVFDADVMVLTDCENPSTEIPGITVSLRGLYEVELECEALESDVHSGLFGNMVPDPGNALVLLLGRLLDEDGRMKLGRMPIDTNWREASRSALLDRATLREAAHLVNGVEPLPERDRTAAEWLWRQPALTILSTTFPHPDEHKNAVRCRAAATLSIRLAPGQTAEDMRPLLERALLEAPPGGVRVSLTDRPASAESWLYEPRGPAFDAADRAYERAWGRAPMRIGVGGSIPFVALFGRRYASLPLILNGVLDPLSGAHGANESLHLGVFEKTVAANVCLLHELATTPGIKRD